MDYFSEITLPFPAEEELEIGAYKATDWATWVVSPEGPPPGSPIATTIVKPGEIKFTGLAENSKYFMGAPVGESGKWRWRVFWTFEPPREMASASDIAIEEAGQRLEIHANATTNVHGVTNFANFLAKPESPATFTQTYSTAGRTHAKAAMATNLPTNLNIVTTLLGTLVGEVNTTNGRVNQMAEAVNELKGLVNALVDDSQRDGFSK